MIFLQSKGQETRGRLTRGGLTSSRASYVIGLVSIKTLMLGKIDCRRKRGQEKIRWLGGITDTMDMSLSRLWEIVKDREALCAEAHGAAKRWTRLGD